MLYPKKEFHSLKKWRLHSGHNLLWNQTKSLRYLKIAMLLAWIDQFNGLSIRKLRLNIRWTIMTFRVRLLKLRILILDLLSKKNLLSHCSNKIMLTINLVFKCLQTTQRLSTFNSRKTYLINLELYLVYNVKYLAKEKYNYLMISHLNLRILRYKSEAMWIDLWK
jgi:hypothetical protein